VREDREKSYKRQAVGCKLQATGYKIVTGIPVNKKAGEHKIHLPF